MQLLLEAPESQMYTPAPFKTLLTPLPRRVRTDIVGFGFIVKNDKTEGLLGYEELVALSHPSGKKRRVREAWVVAPPTCIICA